MSINIIASWMTTQYYLIQRIPTLKVTVVSQLIKHKDQNNKGRQSYEQEKNNYYLDSK